HLKAVPGVAEVAAVGGFVRQYQVNVDPNRLQAYDISIGRVVEAVRSGNVEVGGRLIEFGGTEYMVRGRGYAKTLDDFGDIVLSATEDATPIRIRDIGEVTLGPDYRRGLADLDGTGEVVSGIIVMRQDQNALTVIDAVKKRLKEIAAGLPEGVKVIPVYDRSDLIRRAIGTVKSTLIEIIVTVSLVIFVFLWHPPSSLIPIITIPIAVLMAFIPFRAMGITANIMSLGGIAIAIGAMADAGIVVVEQTHKRLEEWHKNGQQGDHRAVMVDAIKQVAGPSFFALLVIAVSFLPVLTLEAEEGRLFKPLAYTKTFAMIFAAFLAVTLDPALRLALTNVRNFGFRPRWISRTFNAIFVGKIRSEERHPISRRLMRLYEPAASWSLRHKWRVIEIAAVILLLTVPAFMKLGSEFMPPLDEGAIFYMPTTMPGISITEAQRLLQLTDRIIKGFPEVDRVLGKAGRADTSMDPAPLSMLETVVMLKPTSEWRKVDTWYASWAPEGLKKVLRHVTPDHISREALVGQLNDALRIPGLSNAWTMPIKARIDMLTTGVRTPVGIKISGADLKVIEQIGAQVEEHLLSVKGTRSVFAERTSGGYFLDIRWKREQLARYGLSIEEAQRVVLNAIGGENVTTTIQGRERYPVNVRYMPDFRSDFGSLGRLLVPALGGRRQIALNQLADIVVASEPAMIRDEDGLLTGYVYVDLADRDPGSYVSEASEMLKKALQLPVGYALIWTGQYESMQRVKEHLTVIVPLTLFLVFLLLYMNTKSITKTMIIFLAVPFSAVGAVWFLYLLGYNMSIAVWVGLIALLGVDAETGVFMLLYLDLAYEKARREGRLRSLHELRQAILEGAVKRLRPKLMTVATMFIGLIPIMWSTGTGADVMKRIAAPMIGGIFTSFILELLVYPAIYEIWKWHFEVKKSLVTSG
ncbi:MAG: efflux RND transporter permease subunit, partial [Planctomycetota bacterium]